MKARENSESNGLASHFLDGLRDDACGELDRAELQICTCRFMIYLKILLYFVIKIIMVSLIYCGILSAVESMASFLIVKLHIHSNQSSE